MSTDRQLITSILDVPVYLTTTGTPARNGGWVMELRRVDTDELVATLNTAELFDENGNRFHYDAD